MRTGNTYHEVWTLKDGVSSIENHEYKLFRWAEIVVTGPTAGMELDLSAWVVSRTIIAGIWVAFFQECQQLSCGQAPCGSCCACGRRSSGIPSPSLYSSNHSKSIDHLNPELNMDSIDVELVLWHRWQAPGDGVGGGRGERHPDLRAEQHLRQGIHLS